MPEPTVFDNVARYGTCPKHGPIQWHDGEGSPYCPECDVYKRPSFLHNVIAHPLMWLWPRLGEWLHERTEP